MLEQEYIWKNTKQLIVCGDDSDQNYIKLKSHPSKENKNKIVYTVDVNDCLLETYDNLSDAEDYYMEWVQKLATSIDNKSRAFEDFTGKKPEPVSNMFPYILNTMYSKYKEHILKLNNHYDNIIFAKSKSMETYHYKGYKTYGKYQLTHDEKMEFVTDYVYVFTTDTFNRLKTKLKLTMVSE